MVASSMSMPRCQPKLACRSKKWAVTESCLPTLWLCSLSAIAMATLDGPKPMPMRSWTSGVSPGRP